jgi:hypothetical protein
MKPTYILLASLFLTPSIMAEVVIYPDPGDLSAFQNLRKSERYAVSVNGKRTTVYASNNRTGKDVDGRDIPKGYITDAHFCYFSGWNRHHPGQPPSGTVSNQAQCHERAHHLPDGSATEDCA